MRLQSAKKEPRRTGGSEMTSRRLESSISPTQRCLNVTSISDSNISSRSLCIFSFFGAHELKNWLFSYSTGRNERATDREIPSTNERSKKNIFLRPKTNMDPENDGFQVRNPLFQGSIFRCHVSFGWSIFIHLYLHAYIH